MSAPASVPGSHAPASHGLAKRGIVILALFAAVHLLGLREYLPLLCGSPAPGTLPREVQALFCTTYLVLYFAAVLVAPVLLIAAAVLKSRKG